MDGTPLPVETKVKVSSGSGVEVYDAEKPLSTPQTVFCDRADLVDGGAVEAGAPDGGDAGAGLDGGIAAIGCRLWTDGAADVTVEARGFVIARSTFRANSDSCGIVTTDATVTLTRLSTDAGP